MSTKNTYSTLKHLNTWLMRTHLTQKGMTPTASLLAHIFDSNSSVLETCCLYFKATGK